MTPTASRSSDRGLLSVSLASLLTFVLLAVAGTRPALAQEGDQTAGADTFQSRLRAVVVSVAATNQYMQFKPLSGADDGTVAELGKLLIDPTLSSRQRDVTAGALAWVRTPAALAMLLAHVSDPDQFVRMGIASALGSFRDDSGRTRQILTDLAANDPATYTDAKTGATRYRVREEAQYMLGRLDRAPPMLTPATSPPVLPAVAAATTAAPVTASRPVAPSGANALPPPVTKAPPCLSVLRVEGTWEKQPGSTGDLTTTGDGRLKFTLPVGGIVTAKRSDPLPTGPWTLDLWELNKPEDLKDDVKLILTFGGDAGPGQAVVVELTIGWWNAGVSVQVGGSSGRRTTPFPVEHARGPVQWLQLSYTPEKNMQVRINGVAMPAWSLGPVDLPTAPVTLAVVSAKASTVQVASFVVGPCAPIAQPPEGLLHGGWSTPPRKLPEAEATPLMGKLQGFASDSSFPCPARMYALAALALLQCAQDGHMSDALWQQMPPVQGAGVDQVWRIETLPLLLACSSPAQRQAAAPQIQAAIAQLKGARMAPNVSRDDVTIRIALFAPHAIADALSTFMHEVDQPRMTTWLQELAQDDPCTSFTLWNSMPDNPNDPRFHAWTAGRLRTLIPNYSRLLLDSSLLSDPFADVERCRAAVEMARTDRPAAHSLFEQVKNVTCRVAVAPALGIELPAVLPPELAAPMERALRNRVLAWQPSRFDKAPAWPMLGLAEFLQKQGRAAEAEATLRDMAAKVSALPEAPFHNIWPVAKGMAELQMPEAGAWMDRAVAQAQADDKGKVEPDPGSGEVYFAPTFSVVQFLDKQGTVDRALSLALSLNPDNLPMNYNNAVINVVYACASRAPERIVDLLPNIITEDRIAASDRQVEVISHLLETPAIAASPWPEQWIHLLPPDKRLVPTVQLAVARGKPLEGELQLQFGQLLSSEIERYKPWRGNGWSDRTWCFHQLETMSLTQVQQYERCVIGNPDCYCCLLLNGVIRETGLENDPIWRIWRAPDTEGGEWPWTLPPDRLVEIGVGAKQ